MHGAQHVQAAALREIDIEDDRVGQFGEDPRDGGIGAVGAADRVHAVDRIEHVEQPVAHLRRILDDENLEGRCSSGLSHGCSLNAAAAERYRRALNRGIGIRNPRASDDS